MFGKESIDSLPCTPTSECSLVQIAHTASVAYWSLGRPLDSCIGLLPVPPFTLAVLHSSVKVLYIYTCKASARPLCCKKQAEQTLSRRDRDESVLGSSADIPDHDRSMAICSSVRQAYRGSDWGNTAGVCARWPKYGSCGSLGSRDVYFSVRHTTPSVHAWS